VRQEEFVDALVEVGRSLDQHESGAEAGDEVADEARGGRAVVSHREEDGTGARVAEGGQVESGGGGFLHRSSGCG
jgi:hypothetical protein